MIWLMNSTTTPLDPRVREVMIPLLEEDPGRDGSFLTDARSGRRILDEARARVASLCGGEDDGEIVFTSGGTEACNMAIKGIALAALARGGPRRLIACATEHTAVLYPMRTLARLGFDVHECPVDGDGVVSVEALAALLAEPTLCVSVAPVNAETGTMQPMEEVVRLARVAGAAVHADACVTAAYELVRAADRGIDLVSLSAHKIGGPRGCGALYARRGVRLTPLVEGGTEEGGRRGGASSPALIAGFGAAASFASSEVPGGAGRRARLDRRLAEGILAVPGTRRNGPAGARAPGLLNVSVEGCDGEALMTALARCGIALSSGSSCFQEAGKPSHVLTAMGRDGAHARGSVLFALGRVHTEEEIDSVVSAFASAVASLRAIAPRTGG